MKKLSKQTQNLFNEEMVKIEGFLENYKKINGDNFGNMISEIDLQKQRVEVIKGEMERLTKLNKDDTEIILKEVKGHFMNALKHQEKLIQSNKHKIASGREFTL